MYKVMYKVAIKAILLSLCTAQAYAVNYLSTDMHRGFATQTYSSPGGYQEICVIPKPFPGLNYSVKAIENLQELCGMDHYDYSRSASVAMCPKIAPTNPGLLYYSFTAEDADSRDQYENTYCKLHKSKRPGKKIAKFKSGLTCSYTPSNLAYYQVAQALGGILQIPEVSLRTMDKNEHLKYVKKAQTTATNSVAKSAWGYNWQFIYDNPNIKSNRSGSTRPPWVLTTDKKAVFGALMKNPRSEFKYSEMNGYRSYDSRYADFKTTKAYRNIADSRSIENMATGSFAASAQLLTQMKDVSDMVIIDTLLNQQDRPGNIHYRFFAYYLVNGQVMSKKVKVSGGKIAEDDLVKIRASGGEQISVVKKMLIKDTDCGVAKSNMARINNWLEGVRHVSPDTYYRLLWLQQASNTREVEDYFKDELLFSNSDWNGKGMHFKSNLNRAVEILKSGCEAGTVRLDLDLQSFVEGSLPSRFEDSCELPYGLQI